MTTTTVKATNLVKDAKRAAYQLGSKIGDDNINLTVAQLKGKVPALSVFDDDMAAIQLYRYNGTPQGGTLRIYLENGEPKLFDAALNPVSKDVKFASWTIGGYSGTATIEVDEKAFIVKLPLKTDSPLDKSSGEGLPDRELLQAVPQPGAIAFSSLKLLQKYTLIERNPQKGTCTIEDEEGNQTTVYEARALTELVEENGGELPLEFQIYDWELTQIEGEHYKLPHIEKVDDADFGDLL